MVGGESLSSLSFRTRTRMTERSGLLYSLDFVTNRHYSKTCDNEVNTFFDDKPFAKQSKDL